MKLYTRTNDYYVASTLTKFWSCSNFPICRQVQKLTLFDQEEYLGKSEWILVGDLFLGILENHEHTTHAITIPRYRYGWDIEEPPTAISTFTDNQMMFIALASDGSKRRPRHPPFRHGVNGVDFNREFRSKLSWLFMYHQSLRGPRQHPRDSNFATLFAKLSNQEKITFFKAAVLWDYIISNENYPFQRNYLGESGKARPRFLRPDPFTYPYGPVIDLCELISLEYKLMTRDLADWCKSHGADIWVMRNAMIIDSSSKYANMSGREIKDAITAETAARYSAIRAQIDKKAKRLRDEAKQRRIERLKKITKLHKKRSAFFKKESDKKYKSVEMYFNKKANNLLQDIINQQLPFPIYLIPEKEFQNIEMQINDLDIHSLDKLLDILPRKSPDHIRKFRSKINQLRNNHIN
jgi:hypothetical protein